MANNNRLKAFVRYDGSGRVVPSSLILARFKPKVGNYKEIDAYECCNDVTTTTSSTTTTTTTAIPSFSVRYYMGSYNPAFPCINPAVSGNPQYAGTNDPFLLTQLYSDAELTIPTIMSSGYGYYSFSYDGGATVYSAQFDATGAVIVTAISCS
jgi:hypothetical protein